MSANAAAADTHWARRTSLAALAAVLALALVVVLLARWGPDWPAQEFRAWQFAHDGITAWTTRWYGGEALIGYSVIYPVLAGALGVGTVGIAAVVLAAWAASAFAPQGPVRARLFTVAVAVCVIQSLLIGQLPYLLGVAFGLLAMRVAFGATGRPLAAAGCAALCSLASPLAGATLAVAAPALTAGYGWRRTAPLCACAVGIGASALLGGASGPYLFQGKSLLGVVIFCALVLALARTDAHALRWFAVCYLLAAVAAFVVANPIGGNAARVGKLIALPLAVRFLPFDRTMLSRLVAGVAAAASYHHWLADNAVTLVALADAPIDYGGPS